MLTSKQRAYLRALAQKIDPIFQIGKSGVTEEICYQLSNAMEARELIKIKVLENSGYTAAEAAQEIAAATAADVVAVIGYRFVLYRPSEKKQQIELPPAK